MRCCWPFLKTENGENLTEPLLLEKKSVSEIIQILNKIIRAKYAQANQMNIKAKESENLARQTLRIDNDKVLATHYLTEKHRLLYLYKTYLSDISNLNQLVDTLTAASRNLELTKHLSSASMTLDDLLKALPKDSDELLQKIRFQTEDVQLQSNLFSKSNTETTDDAITDELELLLEESFPCVPINTHEIEITSNETKKDLNNHKTYKMTE